ncbi:unnamed protein product [Lactuca virosa]|uniref:Jacalin-type lectin domain-containing protein n=1 Tax=Lactuca virosa TaxID=75947 RepID=A0AAU9MTK4_9ASTR|nr:unnamed protein product [Lactuca virosa]
MAGSTVWLTPWGGKGGNTWQFIIPDGARIIKISVRSGDILDSICLTYKDESGYIFSERYGGNGGSLHNIEFADDENLIGISGRFGTFQNLTVITSFSFQTNIKTYGPFGLKGGTDFSIGLAEGKFFGFYGRSGSYIDALGVILQP